jgi:hypothetical protein
MVHQYGCSLLVAHRLLALLPVDVVVPAHDLSSSAHRSHQARKDFGNAVAVARLILHPNASQ